MANRDAQYSPSPGIQRRCPPAAEATVTKVILGGQMIWFIMLGTSAEKLLGLPWKAISHEY